MKNHLTIKLELTDMIWTAEPRNALAAVRAYCPFLNSGELAAEITERAIEINQAYQNNAPAKELDQMMLTLKQKATGLNVTDARGMSFIPEYRETLDELPYFRGAIGVDLLVNEENSYE